MLTPLRKNLSTLPFRKCSEDGDKMLPKVVLNEKI